MPRKILQENPRENPPNFIQQKSSNTFLQIGRGKKWLPKSDRNRKKVTYPLLRPPFCGKNRDPVADKKGLGYHTPSRGFRMIEKNWSPSAWVACIKKSSPCSVAGVRRPGPEAHRHRRRSGISKPPVWLFAQKPFEAPNRPKPPQTPNFPKNPASPRNPPGIPTEFILSAIQNPTEFHWIPLNFPETSRISPNSPKFHRIPEISRKTGEERNSRN